MKHIWNAICLGIVCCLCAAAGYLGALLLLQGCSSAQVQPGHATLDCRYAVLEPYLGEITHELVKEALTGKVNLGEVLLSLGYTPEDVLSLAKRWAECMPPAPPAPPLLKDAGA